MLEMSGWESEERMDFTSLSERMVNGILAWRWGEFLVCRLFF